MLVKSMAFKTGAESRACKTAGESKGFKTHKMIVFHQIIAKFSAPNDLLKIIVNFST